MQTDNEEGLKLTGSTAYSNGLLVSETDDAGTQTSYTYNAKRQLHKVISANGQTITTQYEDVYGYPSAVYQSGKISAGYEYTNGNLSGISRGGYITSGGAKQNQTYGFGYDVFGNLTSVSVGNNRLTGYTYNSGNGTLKTMSFGVESNPLATISYGYDKLDRVKNVTYHDTNSGQSKTYGYRYSADGNLAGVTEGSELKYTYEYDSLGRLIYSSQLENGNTKLYTKHQYDASDRITAQSWQIGNEAFSESYTYREADGSIQSMNIGNETIGFTYNGLKQLTKRTSPKFDTAYEYRVLDEEKQIVTSQISSVNYLKPGSTEELLPTLSYAYDAVGNITGIQSGNATAAQYSYDEQNQLKKEILPSQTSSYGYDTYGNMRSKTITDSQNQSESYAFSYENTNWLDQLTKVSYTDKNGTTTTKALTYDSIGNPLSYFNGKSNWTFTWKYGRELAAATCGDTSIAYTYNENGIRESKTVGNIIHKYLTLDDKVIRETYGNTTIDYFYDEQGRAHKLVAKENGTTYTGYFVLNQQGDTIALLDANGAVAVTYEYDAWGKEISHSTIGTVGNKLYQYNALKYRGYYFDTESGFYYVSSRYYDPEIGRFINADAPEILLVEQGNLLQYNLYTYCWNNPVNMLDTTGESPANIIGAIAGGVAGASLGILLAKELKLTGAKKKALIAAATVGGAALGAFLGPYAAKLGKKVISAVKTVGKKVACKVTKKGCFIAGTVVLTEDGNIPIEEVKEGDYVYAENPETGEKGLKRVVQTFINESDELIHIYVNDEEIVATPLHPFYVSNKGWIGAVDLRAGDILVLQSGEYVIVELVQHEILEAPINVYNFEVEDFHTYYVGEGSVLVHNMCDRITNVSKAESKIWKKLQSAKNGLKKSGSGKNLRYYSWDNLHNEIEVFDRFGKHLGVMDPTTGQIIKSAVRGRSIKI